MCAAGARAIARTAPNALLACLFLYTCTMDRRERLSYRGHIITCCVVSYYVIYGGVKLFPIEDDAQHRFVLSQD
jgi:hypothetical protein